MALGSIFYLSNHLSLLRPMAIILSPNSLKASIKSSLLIRIVLFLLALAVFLASIYVNAAVTELVLKNVIVEKFTFEGFEKVPVKIMSYQELLHFSVIKFLTILTGISLFVILAVLIRGFRFKVLQTATLLLSSFVILVILAGLQAYMFSNLQPIHYSVIYVELGNVTFQEANFIGLSDLGEPVQIKSPLVTVSKLKIYRIFENGTIVSEYPYMSREDLDLLLESTSTLLNMSDVMWYEDGKTNTLKKFHVINASFSNVSYDRVLSLKDIRTNEVAPIEGITVLVSMIAPFLMSAYIAVGFKRIYSCSAKYAAGIGLIVYILLSVFMIFTGLI